MHNSDGCTPQCCMSRGVAFVGAKFLLQYMSFVNFCIVAIWRVSCFVTVHLLVLLLWRGGCIWYKCGSIRFPRSARV